MLRKAGDAERCWRLEMKGLGADKSSLQEPDAGEVVHAMARHTMGCISLARGAHQSQEASCSLVKKKKKLFCKCIKPVKKREILHGSNNEGQNEAKLITSRNQSSGCLLMRVYNLEKAQENFTECWKWVYSLV